MVCLLAFLLNPDLHQLQDQQLSLQEQLELQGTCPLLYSFLRFYTEAGAPALPADVKSLLAAMLQVCPSQSL